MADHISVDVSLLRETSRRLAEVADTLRAAQGTAQDDAQAVAQPDLAGAMREFASNWRVHREKLISTVSGGQKFVSSAADAYERLDQDLAANIKSSGGTSTPSPAQPSSGRGPR